jgi:hypothetical protein
MGYATALYVLYPWFNKSMLFFAFRLRPHDETHVTTAFVLVMLCVLAAARVRDGIYAFANTLLLITFHIPLLTLAPYFSPELMETMAYFTVAASSLILSGFGALAPQRTYLGFRHALPVQFELVPMLVLFGICFTYVFWTFRNVMSFSFSFAIYDQRALYGAAASGMSGYFLNWLLYIAAPGLIIMGMRKRLMVLVAAGIAGALLVFLVNGAKGALAIGIMVFIFSLTERFSRALVSKTLIATGALAALLISYYVDRAIEFPVLSPFVADRTLYAHGIINMMIIEDFAEKPFNFWSNSFLRSVQDQVFAVDPFILVTQSFYNSSFNANTNFFGDGIINLGVVGALIMTVVTAVTLLISQAIFNRHDTRLRLLFIPIVFGMTNGPIQMVIVTGGLALIWAILLIMPVSARQPGQTK